MAKGSNQRKAETSPFQFCQHAFTAHAETYVENGSKRIQRLCEVTAHGALAHNGHVSRHNFVDSPVESPRGLKIQMRIQAARVVTR